MSTPTLTRTAPDRQARLARAPVAALFLTNGAVFFNVVPRYPQIKEALALSNAALGTALGLVAGYHGGMCDAFREAVESRLVSDVAFGAAGKGAPGTGSYGLALVEAVHFYDAAEPARPVST